MSLSTTQYGYIVDPMVPFTDDKGKTIKNGFIRVFMAGTSTPVLTYRNYDGATNQEKIELDNSGRVKHNVIGSKGSLYKVVVYNILHSQENPLLTVDKIAVLGSSINASGATIVTGLDSVTVPEENFLKATVEGTDVELALDPTEVTSEVSTTADAVTAAPDYVVPLLDKTGTGDGKKISLANLFKFALDWISRLATTVTSFVSGDFIVVSNNTNGARKMSKDTLLELTAQNALAGNVAEEFDPTKPNDDGGYAYYKDEIVAYNGATYRFKVNHSSGAWNSAEVVRENALFPFKIIFETNDPEYIFALTDSEGFFLAGVKKDGSIEWQKGVPSAIQEMFDDVDVDISNIQSLIQGLSDSKVDKVTGKSLIDSVFAADISHEDDSEFVYAILTNENYILFGIRNDGSFESDGLLRMITGGGSSIASTSYVDEKVLAEENRAKAAENALSEAIADINPVVVEGGENTPDNVFLESNENDAITLKNNTASAYGYGVFNVKPSDNGSVFASTRTIYNIRFPLNLGGSTINLPADVILNFCGGYIYNGELVGNATRANFTTNCIGDDLDVSGTWDIPYIRSDILVSPYANNALKKIWKFLNGSVFNVLHITSGHYYFSPEKNNDILLTVKGDTKVIIDGIIEIVPNGYPNYHIVCVNGVSNVEITGSGSIVGDADDHDYITTPSTHEWGMCLSVLGGAKNVNIHDLEVKDATGDGIYISDNSGNIPKNIAIERCKITHCGRQGISITAGEQISVKECRIDDIYRTLPKAAVDVENESGQPLIGVIVSDLIISRCRGLQVLNSEFVKFERVYAKDCNTLFFASNAKSVLFSDIESYSEVSSTDYVEARPNCTGIRFDNVVMNNTASFEVDVSNILYNDSCNFGTAQIIGVPVASSIRYLNGKFTQFDGISWVNFDGSQI